MPVHGRKTSLRAHVELGVRAKMQVHTTFMHLPSDVLGLEPSVHGVKEFLNLLLVLSCFNNKEAENTWAAKWD